MPSPSKHRNIVNQITFHPHKVNRFKKILLRIFEAFSSTRLNLNVKRKNSLCIKISISDLIFYRGLRDFDIFYFCKYFFVLVPTFASPAASSVLGVINDLV